MASITLKGNPFNTSGELPALGASAPDFALIRQDLSAATLATFAGKKKVLNIYPSIDTPVCAKSVRAFNTKAAARGDAVVLNISADLPFAGKRFCGAENLEGAETLSTFRSTFAKDYGVEILDGPLAGLCARAVVVADEHNRVVFTELVTEIGDEPTYEAALATLGATASA